MPETERPAKSTGTIAAAGRGEAVAALAGQPLFPMEVNDAAPAVIEARRVRRVPAAPAGGHLRPVGRSAAERRAPVAGVGGDRATDLARRAEIVLGEIHRLVEDGATLADAMGRFQSVLGEMAVSMVRAGGEGGFLEEALSRVAQFTETQDDLRKRALGAVAYPAFLTVTGTVIVIGLLVFLVPSFTQLYDRLRDRGELPMMTDLLLGTSNFLKHWGLLLLVVVLAGGWIARRWLKTDAGSWWLDRLRLRFPLAGPIFLGLAVSRFCRVLGTLLHNGVPILRSLEISRDATGNRILAAAIGKATENISAGQSLAGPLGASGQFPPVVVEMIAVAEQANNLEGVLLSVADSMERRTWRRVDLSVRLLEPVLLLLLAGVILLLVIALMLPLLKMSAAV